MKLSIIIPVYNSEKTLQRCVNSILQQSFRDFELLLIDDGSTDNSARMIDEMALFDKRIKVIHKTNGGLSDARNTGLALASGTYVTFVDSDDEVTLDTYKYLVDILRVHLDYDILEYPVTERKGCPNQHIFTPKEKSYTNALDWLAEKGLEHCWACNKIFKTSFIKEIKFPKGKNYEDVYFTGEFITQNPTIGTTNKGMYLYYWNDNGIVAEKNMLDLLEAQLRTIKTLSINTKEKKWHRLYLNMFTSQLYAYTKTKKILLNSQRVTIKKYNNNSDIIKAILVNIFGVSISCKIFKFLTSI